MGLRLKWTLVFVAAMIVSGCMTIGPTRFPEPSTNAAPRKEYNASVDTVWKTVYDVLENNRMPVASSDRKEGRITTEYVAGQSKFVIMSTMSTRYKYTIHISPAGNRVTRLNILASLESTSKEVPAWRDISGENKEIVSDLENWLYEQVQNKIRT